MSKKKGWLITSPAGYFALVMLVITPKVSLSTTITTALPGLTTYLYRQAATLAFAYVGWG
jgi:hypothetical protein